jgi:alpha-soluble NSF attachment protein
MLCCVVLCCACCYRDIDLHFAGSREANMLDSCREALAAADEKGFATAVAEYDSMTRLDTWKTNMLLRVKRRLQARSAGQEAGDNSEDELL